MGLNYALLESRYASYKYIDITNVISPLTSEFSAPLLEEL